MDNVEAVEFEIHESWVNCYDSRVAIDIYQVVENLMYESGLLSKNDDIDVFTIGFDDVKRAYCVDADIVVG